MGSKKMGESSEHPVKLHDGYYKVSGHRAQFMRINGNTATLKDVHETFVFLTTITYGVYGEAHFKIKEKVNKYCKNNVMFTAPENKGKETEMLYQLPIEYGVISEDGKKCYVEGRIIWLCGPPGTGKSTAAQIIARNHGYVYYEADTFNQMRNPFIDLNVTNPSLAQYGQKILKGPGAKERVTLIQRFQAQLGPMVAGLEYDTEALKEFYSKLSEDIKRQKSRIGGDWVIANVAFSRDIRDAIRLVLGEELQFIGLTLNETECMRRIKSRHDDQPEILEKIRVIFCS